MSKISTVECAVQLGNVGNDGKRRNVEQAKKRVVKCDQVCRLDARNELRFELP